jgi:transcriptional regulator with XRE-family HTH domain
MAARLGRTCRRHREACGLRQIDVATHAGVAHTTVSNLERGARWVRETDRIVDALAELCGVSAQAIWLEALNENDPGANAGVDQEP